MTNPIQSIPPDARALTSIGDLTTAAVIELYEGSTPLFGLKDSAAFLGLADALRQQSWTDSEAAALLRAYAGVHKAHRGIEVATVTRWVLAHDTNAGAATIAECMKLEAPPEVEVLRVLSRRGSQKMVFLATWRLRQNEVVLKQIMGPPDHVARILERELLPHPLGMAHRNIIETHLLRNSKNEAFLAEKRLREVLTDSWRAGGLNDAANLCHDIGAAIGFLHENQLVHGDIKPDNIGRDSERFVLLDFGICRPGESFTAETTPTGSLRTRAPELLDGSGRVDPYKADIWALGATLFNAMIGRFPLFSRDEEVPRVSNAEERTAAERKLRARVESEWDKYVDYSGIELPLRNVLERTLAKDPADRIDAAGLLRAIETELPAFLRSSPSSRFSAHDDYLQIRDYLRSPIDAALIPLSRRQQILNRLRDLVSLPGFSREEQEDIRSLEGSLK